MGRELLATSVAIMVGLATAGCATTPDTEMDPTNETGDAPTVVEVTNNHSVPVTIQAVSSGGDQRLGQVAANATERFSLPSSVRGDDLRISVDATGSAETYLSPHVPVTGNDVVMVTVASNIALTRVSVR